MLRLLIVLLLILSFFASPAATGAATPDGKKLVIAYAAMNARVLPALGPRERGFFNKYGFDAEILFVRGARPWSLPWVKEIEVGYTGGTAVIGAVASGSDLKVLSALTNRVTYDLVVRPGIKSPEDLRGKKFGVQSIGGTVWMGAILALEHLGLEPERDKIAVIAAGDQTVLAQALANGHHRRDRIGRRAEPAIASKGLSDSGRTRQAQAADLKLFDSRS